MEEKQEEKPDQARWTRPGTAAAVEREQSVQHSVLRPEPQHRSEQEIRRIGAPPPQRSVARRAGHCFLELQLDFLPQNLRFLLLAGQGVKNACGDVLGNA